MKRFFTFLPVTSSYSSSLVVDSLDFWWLKMQHWMERTRKDSLVRSMRATGSKLTSHY